MNAYTCAICTKVIPASVIAARHYSPEKPMPPTERMVCSRECSVELRRRAGQYQAMSQAGKEDRGQAVARSNRQKPRRARKGARRA